MRIVISEFISLDGVVQAPGGRDEDPDDPDVWAVTCFVTRVGFRRRGISRALAAASVEHARERGATAVEGYPLVALPGQEFSWGELYVGSRSVLRLCLSSISGTFFSDIFFSLGIGPVDEQLIEPPQVRRRDGHRGKLDRVEFRQLEGGDGRGGRRGVFARRGSRAGAIFR